MQRRIFIIAGPNGAGKTTNAQSVIPEFISVNEFINADEIARGLAPLNPESMTLMASKLMLKRLRELLQANKSFAFETTASGTNYIKYIQQGKERGYEINLLFLWLSAPDLAIKRVAQRVEQGGHHIAEHVIRRRYQSGLKNMIKYYLPLADSVLIIDNSVAGSNKIIARKDGNRGLKIEDFSLWEEIQRIVNG